MLSNQSLKNCPVSSKLIQFTNNPQIIHDSIQCFMQLILTSQPQQQKKKTAALYGQLFKILLDLDRSRLRAVLLYMYAEFFFKSVRAHTPEAQSLEVDSRMRIVLSISTTGQD